MSLWAWAAIAVGVAIALYAALVAALVVAGRRPQARAVARLLPDCGVLVWRLSRSGTLSRPRRLALAGCAAYLLMPFDLVPDVIPVAGAVDDAVVVMLALRIALRGAGPGVVTALWPGPRESLHLVLRLAGLRTPQVASD